MRILLNDIMQFASGVPDSIKSPALADIYTADIEFDATFSTSQTIDCVGIGYTDAASLIVDNGSTTRTVTITKTAPEQNGLYILDAAISGTDFNISHNGTFIGRVGIGTNRRLGVNPSMEPGFYTTSENRTTLSGQIIPGAGGFAGFRFEADVRYKIDSDVYNDIILAYNTQIMRGFPYFINTNDEQHKLPPEMLYFYAATTEPLGIFQSSTYKFLYSKKFSFQEKF